MELDIFMIKIALFYEDVFNRANLRDPMCKICPTEADWENARLIIGKLQLFYKATEMLLGSKYPAIKI